MIRVMFVCHGNICRSPMAEYLFKQYVKDKGVENSFFIASCATSTEEIGNPVHWGTKTILNQLGISCAEKRATQLTRKDYNDFDFFIGMDKNNVKNMIKIFGDDSKKKIFLLLDFVKDSRDIRDPWYTGNFKETYEDICIGLEGFYKYLIQNYEVDFIKTEI